MPIEHLGRIYEVTASPRAGASRVRLDRLAARRLLSVAMNDAARVRELRALLAAGGSAAFVSRMTDVEVIAHVAARVGTARLEVVFESPRRTQYSSQEVEPVSVVLAPLVAVADEAPVDDPIDAEIQSLALRQAAQDGLPFCEECEKARQEAEAAAPDPEPFADNDVVAQADALRQAADAGTPFCEECERARQEEAAAAAAGTGA